MVDKAQIIEIDWQALKETINNSKFVTKLSAGEIVDLCTLIHKACPIKINNGKFVGD